MPRRKARLHAAAACAALIGLFGAQAAQAQRMDPVNPTCPQNPNWSTYAPMRFTSETRNGVRILLAEGVIDEDTPTRLQEAIDQNSPEEVWLRSPGGNARAGNQAGFIIREAGLTTRVPSGWACFSACNFIFMGGAIRFIDRGGLFIVHMFTQLQNGSTVREQIARGGQSTVETVSNVEQGAALLATEDNDFLIRMGVSRRLLTEVMYQQRAIATASERSTRRCLTQAEVREYNVADNGEAAPAEPTRATAPRQQQRQQSQPVRQAEPQEEPLDPK